MNNLQDWLENWNSKIDSKLNAWIQKIPNNYSKFFDFTPPSLLKLEEYLLTKFEAPSEAKDVKNRDEFECVSTYIGEVFRRNIDYQLRWKISEDLDFEKADELIFIPYLQGEQGDTGFNPISRIPNLIKARTGEKLMTFYYAREKVYKKYKNLKVSTLSEVTFSEGKNMYNYFLFGKKDSFLEGDFEMKIEPILREFYSVYKFIWVKNNFLKIKFNDGYTFRFYLENSTDSVAEFSNVLNGGNSENFDCRIEFNGDNDFEKRYFNIHLLLLEELNKQDWLVYNIDQNNVLEFKNK